MKNHRWSEEDFILLENNVKQFGVTKGCEKSSEELYVSKSSCVQQYYNRVNKFKKSGIKVDHPERLKNAKVVEEKPVVHRRKRLTAEEEQQLADYLKKEISKNPNNLREVFKRAAVEFGFSSYMPIQKRWYGHSIGLKNKNGELYNYKKKPSYKGNMGPVFSIIGENAVVNGKNQNNPTLKKTGWIMTILRKWINKK